MSLLDDIKSIKKSIKSNDIASKSIAFDKIGVPKYIFDEYYQDDIDIVCQDIEYYCKLLKSSVDKHAKKNVAMLYFADAYYKYI